MISLLKIVTYNLMERRVQFQQVLEYILRQLAQIAIIYLTHSFKFAAALQAAQAKDGPPVLIRIETKAGHGGGTALSKVIEETADEWGFLLRVLGMRR